MTSHTCSLADRAECTLYHDFDGHCCAPGERCLYAPVDRPDLRQPFDMPNRPVAVTVIWLIWFLLGFGLPMVLLAMSLDALVV